MSTSRTAKRRSIIRQTLRRRGPSEDSVFFQPAKQGNRRYRHLIPGAHYKLTGVGERNKIT